MTAPNLLDLVRKRHEGDGWQVFSELANGTGYKVKGWADAAALGIWPSRGYELHGYEFKISREDLKKELRDPSKADNVGAYCDYWWLALSDEGIMDGLVIPETWGILVPRGGVLRAVRKAPKLEAKPFDRAFCAAMIRNVVKTWVPKHKHEQLKKNALEEAKKELERDREYKRQDQNHELGLLKAKVAAFEAAAGIELGTQWEAGNVGRAVRTVLDLRARRGRHTDPLEIVRGEVATIDRQLAQHAHAAEALRRVREDVAVLQARLEAEGSAAE